eukprot:44281_1
MLPNHWALPLFICSILFIVLSLCLCTHSTMVGYVYVKYYHVSTTVRGLVILAVATMWMITAVNICDSIGIVYRDEIFATNIYLSWNIFWSISKIFLYIIYCRRIYLIHFTGLQFAKKQTVFVYTIIIILIIIQTLCLIIWLWYYNIYPICCTNKTNLQWTSNENIKLQYIAWSIFTLDTFIILIIVLLFFFALKRLNKFKNAHRENGENVSDKKTFISFFKKYRLSILAIISLLTSMIYQILFVITLHPEWSNSAHVTNVSYFTFSWALDNTINITCLYFSQPYSKNKYVQFKSYSRNITICNQQLSCLCLKWDYATTEYHLSTHMSSTAKSENINEKHINNVIKNQQLHKNEPMANKQDKQQENDIIEMSKFETTKFETTIGSSTALVTVTIETALPSRNEGGQYLTLKQKNTLNLNIIDENITSSPTSKTVKQHRLKRIEKHSDIEQIIDEKIENECDIASCNEKEQLINCMGNYNQKIDMQIVDSTLNSFVHLLHQHNESDLEFEAIKQQLKCCDLGKCNVFRRHHRDREKCKNNEEIHNMYKQYNDEDIARLQIIDKIHCFYQHCHDIGNRLSLAEKLFINDENKQKHFDKDFDQYIKNQKLIKLNQILSNKRKKYKHVYSPKQSKKYLAMSMIPNYKNLYCFGCEFKYDGTGEEKDREKEYNELVIVPKYSSLKEELTANIYLTANLTTRQFNTEYIKAQMHYNCEYRKIDYTNISIQNILSLMIYCNFDILQREFTQTYIESGGYKHTHVYHLGKQLKISVHEFGTRIRDGNIKRFYHGIGQQLVFPSIIGDGGIGIRIYCPLSTSSSISVAANFTNNNNGLIVEFANDWSKTKYFSVSWLSDYGDESEYLFIQNEYELQINNIHDAKFGSEFSVIIKALNVIDE